MHCFLRSSETSAEGLGGLPLFTEQQVKVLLGTRASGTDYSRKPGFRYIQFSETRPLKRQSTLVLGGARDAAICYFCSLNAPLGKAVVVDREAKKGGSSSCNLKSHPPSTIDSEGYTT